MEREGYGTGQGRVDWQIFELRAQMKSATLQERQALIRERKELSAVTRGMQQTNATLKDSVPIGVNDSYFK